VDRKDKNRMLKLESLLKLITGFIKSHQFGLVATSLYDGKMNLKLFVLKSKPLQSKAMNYLIQLTENREDGYTTTLHCSEKRLNRLEQLSNAGGFKRFDIDVFKETKQRPTQKDKILLNEFLQKIKLFNEPNI
jgi:hypothetical protein